MLLDPLKSVVLFSAPRFGSTIVDKVIEHILPNHEHLGEYLLITSGVDDAGKFIGHRQRPVTVNQSDWRKELLRRLEKIKQLDRPFTIKIFPESFFWTLEPLELMLDNQVIVLNRSNRYEALLSLAIARSQNIWHSSTVIEKHKIAFDIDSIAGPMLQSIIAFDRIREKIKDRVLLNLEYESFSHNFDELKDQFNKVLLKSEQIALDSFQPIFVKQNFNAEMSFSDIETIKKYRQKFEAFC